MPGGRETPADLDSQSELPCYRSTNLRIDEVLWYEITGSMIEPG
jgi:hypothetical protein